MHARSVFRARPGPALAATSRNHLLRRLLPLFQEGLMTLKQVVTPLIVGHLVLFFLHWLLSWKPVRLVHFG